MIDNKKAYHNYEVLDTFEAGMVLEGWEVKSLKAHKGSLQGAYVRLQNGIVILKDMHISPYKYGVEVHQNVYRERVLLLQKKEITILQRAIDEKKLTIIPLKIYIHNRYIKIKIALAKGLKKYDKKHKMKENDMKQDAQRAIQSVMRMGFTLLEMLIVIGIMGLLLAMTIPQMQHIRTTMILQKTQKELIDSFKTAQQTARNTNKDSVIKIQNNIVQVNTAPIKLPSDMIITPSDATINLKKPLGKIDIDDADYVQITLQYKDTEAFITMVEGTNYIGTTPYNALLVDTNTPNDEL